METYSLRPAAETDLDGIMVVIGQAQRAMAALGIDQWQDGYPDRAAFEQDIALGQCYVLDRGGVAGVMVLTLLPERCYDGLTGGDWLSHGEVYATIHRMALGDAARGTGAAGELLAGALELCREKGVAWLRVDTHRGNAVMRRFLEKSGFTECGIVRYDRVRAGDPLRVALERPVNEG